jgi:hypothetical protein
MRVSLRYLAISLMALVIGFTSVQLAAARGQSPAVGTMEICTGTGPIHILVDENGEPTGNIMICPDYALAFFADPLPQATTVEHFESWQKIWRDRISTITGGQNIPESHARGPPRSV